MINFEYIKSIIEAEGSLSFTESNGMLIIVEEDVSKAQTDVSNILAKFGIRNKDFIVTPEGTKVISKDLTATKLALLLAPFIDKERLELVGTYEILVKGLALNITEKDIEEETIDDIEGGEAVVAVQEFLDVESLAKAIDEEFNCDVNLISNSLVETESKSDIIEYLITNEDKFKNFDIEITSDTISYSLNK
jgi:hypothetical protein